jgi:hypothetical protein
MNSTEFSVETLTEDQAQEIAEAFVRGDRDPQRMARILDVPKFDLNLVMHPLVRKFVVTMERAAQAICTMEDHQSQLIKIRDAAFDDENWKVALAAETQRGKASGLYDPKLPGDLPDADQIDPTKLSYDELRRRLAKTIGANLPEDAKALPSPEPGSLEAQEAGENNEI